MTTGKDDMFVNLNLKEIVDVDCLDKMARSATHVVTAITYGGRCALACICGESNLSNVLCFLIFLLT
jgi:hypothetical protein